MPDNVLDLRGVACPMNFVKTKLFVDKLAQGQQVLVLLDAGEPVESVSLSMQEEGHRIVNSTCQSDGHFEVLIEKA